MLIVASWATSVTDNIRVSVYESVVFLMASQDRAVALSAAYALGFCTFRFFDPYSVFYFAYFIVCSNEGHGIQSGCLRALSRGVVESDQSSHRDKCNGRHHFEAPRPPLAHDD